MRSMLCGWDCQIVKLFNHVVFLTVECSRGCSNEVNLDGEFFMRLESQIVIDIVVSLIDDISIFIGKTSDTEYLRFLWMLLHKEQFHYFNVV